MKQLLFAAPFLLAASAGAAQNVLFQSGEHDEFTRLVATLPSEDTDWTVSRDGRFFTIKIEGDDVNLRTSTIFDKIPRDRLANFVANDARGELELELACVCRVVSIPYDGRYVIFDIRDDVPAPQNDDLPQIPLSFGEAVAVKTHQRKFRFSSLEAAKPTPVLAPQKETPEPYNDLLAFDTYVKRNTQVGILREDLIKQVDRAAEQNLLQAAPLPTPDSLVSAPVKTAAVSPDDVVHAGRVPPQAAVGLDGQDLNIVAYNVIDEVGRDIAALLNGQVSAANCLPDSAVNVSAWSGARSFVEELGALRRDVVGEFDRTNEDALQELARLYVHYTFGAEALQVLGLLPATEENRILSAMAHIMDGTALPAGHVFDQQAHCDGNTAFWAALSGQTLIGEGSVHGALDALHAMPRHLREYLGPKLSNQLVSQGETEAATLVLNALERTNNPKDVQFNYAKATLDAEMGNAEAANETLTEIASENSDLATLAVVELIDSHVKQGMAPSADTISLVGALAVEHKSGAMGPSLRRAHALARMMVQEFEPAFEIVEDIEKRDGKDTAARTRSAVAEAMAAHADDFDFIAFAIQQNLAEPGRISADVALTLAQKTFDLGFVDETKRLLQAAQTTTPNDEKRLLKARVALADALPNRAEAELMGMVSEEADRLRARARAMTGDHDGAAQLLANLGETQQAETELWLGGDLAALSGSETSVYRRTAELLKLPVSDVSAPEAASNDGILARNRALLDGSSESRDVLGELLEWHRLSEPSS